MGKKWTDESRGMIRDFAEEFKQNTGLDYNYGNMDDAVLYALRKSKPIKPELYGDGCDNNGNIVIDTWICPNCHEHYEVGYDVHKFCPECGQCIDRSELEDIE